MTVEEYNAVVTAAGASGSTISGWLIEAIASALVEKGDSCEHPT